MNNMKQLLKQIPTQIKEYALRRLIRGLVILGIVVLVIIRIMSMQGGGADFVENERYPLAWIGEDPIHFVYCDSQRQSRAELHRFVEYTCDEPGIFISQRELIATVRNEDEARVFFDAMSQYDVRVGQNPVPLPGGVLYARSDDSDAITDAMQLYRQVAPYNFIGYFMYTPDTVDMFKQ